MWRSVSTDIQGAKSSIEFDLDREKMEKIIVDGYKKFKSFDCEQRTFDPADVTQILVYKMKENIESLQPTDESKHQNKNSDKWNNIVLQYGQLMNEHLEIRKPEPSLLEDFRFAKKQSITNSIDTINDFCKTMITLVSGFFIAYFALMKFLGVNNASNQLLLIMPQIFLFSV